MPDDLVTVAVANWGARFTANGVDATDFTRLTRSIERWGDWCTTWCRAAAEHAALGHEAISDGRFRSAGAHLAQAATYYHFAKFLFVDDQDQARGAHALAVAAMDAALPHLDPPGRRESVPYDGGVLVGILRCPPGPDPHPTVVLVAGVDSAKEEFTLVQRSFLERGMATFAFDGPGQGEAEWHLRARPDWEDVGTAVLDHLAGLTEVDERRLGIWGVSLGGYYAARMASDPRVRACISLSGPFDLGAAWSGLNALTRRAFQVRARCPTPESAGSAAQAWTLEGRASRITGSLLVIMGGQDRLFPWRDGLRLAEEAGGVHRFLLLERGDHGCANVVHQHRPRAADWMAQELSAERR